VPTRIPVLELPVTPLVSAPPLVPKERSSSPTRLVLTSSRYPTVAVTLKEMLCCAVPVVMTRGSKYCVL